MRKRRVLKENAIYHVTARANRQEFILADDKLKQILINVLKRAKIKFGFHLKSFCIMGNHIHLMIKPLENHSLSEIMQWILSVFAVKFNKLYNLKGHVWYDRFHSKIIETLKYYLKVFEYIADNPVKTGITDKRGDYPFESIWFMKRSYFDLIKPPGKLLRRHFPELSVK